MKNFLNKLRVDVASATLSQVILALGAALLASFKSSRDLLWNFGVAQSVPNWVVILPALVATQTLLKVFKKLLRPPHERKYRRELLDGVLWRWSYEKGQISDFRGHCAQVIKGDFCGTRLRLTISKPLPNSAPVSDGTLVFCPECKHSFSFLNDLELEDTQRSRIERRIELQRWRNAVPVAKPKPALEAGFISEENLPPTTGIPEQSSEIEPSSLSWEDIMQAIHKAHPFNKNEAADKFLGSRVRWTYPLSSIRKSSNLLVVALKNEMIEISCVARDHEDRSLINATRNQQITVKGRICGLPPYCRLEDCKFQISPQLVGS